MIAQNKSIIHILQEKLIMKRWIILLIVFGLIGGTILMSSCTLGRVGEYLDSCGCFYLCDCMRYTCESLSGNGEEYVKANGDSFCDSCVDTVWNCTCHVLCSCFSDER